MRGGGESRLDIAVTDFVFGEEIVLEMKVRGRGVRRQRVTAIGNCRKAAVIHFDQSGGILGRVAVLGDNDGDRFADMAHLVLGQDLPVEDMAVGVARQRGDQPGGGEMRGEVGMGQYRRHARRRLCRRRVDSVDPGMGERAPDEAGVAASRADGCRRRTVRRRVAAPGLRAA